MKTKLNQFSKQNQNGVEVLLIDSPEVKREIKKRKTVKKR